jgi:hypothetical protein
MILVRVSRPLSATSKTAAVPFRLGRLPGPSPPYSSRAASPLLCIGRASTTRSRSPRLSPSRGHRPDRGVTRGPASHEWARGAKNPSPTPTIFSYPILNSMKPVAFYCPRLREAERRVDQHAHAPASSLLRRENALARVADDLSSAAEAIREEVAHHGDLLAAKGWPLPGLDLGGLDGRRGSRRRR